MLPDAEPLIDILMHMIDAEPKQATSTLQADQAPALIKFNRPFVVGTEFDNIAGAIAQGHLSADGAYSKSCADWLEQRTGSLRALMVHSCTAALELAITLAGVEAGDEVILPSYTFSSTANAVVLRGAIPVFIDIRPDTLNIDETLVEAAITDRTKAIMPVHYAGVSAEMDTISAVASERDIAIIEDAAQGVMSSYQGKPLGSIGTFGAISFHETKNVICGEGGALLVNDSAFVERAEIIREKGTNRSKFLRGEVDKYTWVDIGSSYAMSDLTAAFLWSQLSEGASITDRRLAIWNRYHEAFADVESAELLRRPIVPDNCVHNAHMYYIVLPTAEGRDRMLGALRDIGVHSVFHYVPLHSAPAGVRYGRVHGSMSITDNYSARLLRLPLWPGMSDDEINRVIDAVLQLV